MKPGNVAGAVRLAGQGVIFFGAGDLPAIYGSISISIDPLTGAAQRSNARRTCSPVIVFFIVCVVSSVWFVRLSKFWPRGPVLHSGAPCVVGRLSLRLEFERLERSHGRGFFFAIAGARNFALADF